MTDPKLSPPEFALAAVPTLLLLLLVMFPIFRHASKRTGIPTWKYFIGSQRTRRTLSLTERLLGFVAMFVALALLLIGMNVIFRIRHGA